MASKSVDGRLYGLTSLIKAMSKTSHLFPGCCSVCDAPLRSVYSWVNHLVSATDDAHVALQEEWMLWTAQYRKQLTCRKCSSVWEVEDKSQSQRKQCPRCVALKASLGKRAYEALTLTPIKYPLQRFSGIKPARLDRKVFADYIASNGIRDAMGHFKLGYSYLKSCFLSFYTQEDYDALVIQGTQRSLEAAHSGAREWWLNLTEDERDAHFGRLCSSSSLEAHLVAQLQEEQILIKRRNAWFTFGQGSSRIVREADLLLETQGGACLVVQCDGEAFHGPNTVFVDPVVKAHHDAMSDQLFLGKGYSVARFSESEIFSGEALECLLEKLLPCERRVHRAWHPQNFLTYFYP